MRIIDAHNHPDWHGYDLDKFIANMDEHGIERTWLLSWECPADEYARSFDSVLPAVNEQGPIPFARCLNYIERCPERFVLGYAPDPRVPGAVNRLRANVETYGVRVCGEIKLRMMYDNPDAIQMFRYCGEAGLPVTVHIDYELGCNLNAWPRPNWWYGGGIEAFERAVKACPDTMFLGHAPGFWANISGDRRCLTEAYPRGPVRKNGKVPKMLRKYPNLYCDLSAGSGLTAISRDPAFGREFLIEFQDRCLFARDYFDGKHKEYLLSLDLPADVLEKIFWRNAMRLVPVGE